MSSVGIGRESAVAGYGIAGAVPVVLIVREFAPHLVPREHVTAFAEIHYCHSLPVCRLIRLASTARPLRPGRLWSAHFLDRSDAKDTQTGGNDNANRPDQRDFCLARGRIAILDKAQRLIVIAPVPQRMQVGRDLVEEKRDPMRLVRAGGMFDKAWPFGNFPGQVKF
nr:hypothetical protein [uncultured Rhodococcus sp.]